MGSLSEFRHSLQRGFDKDYALCYHQLNEANDVSISGESAGMPEDWNMNLEDLPSDLSELWRRYEKAWGFKVPPEIREPFESYYWAPADEDIAIEDLHLVLGLMSELVLFAKGAGARLKKESPHSRGIYMGPFRERVNLAKKIRRALIETGQGQNKRKNWKQVAERFNADNPSEQMTPRGLCRAYHHAMSDTAVAGTVNFYFKPRPASVGGAVSGPNVLITKRKLKEMKERLTT